jgi:hypothetical protein
MTVSGQYRDPATLVSREQPPVSRIPCVPEPDCTKQKFKKKKPCPLCV